MLTTGRSTQSLDPEALEGRLTTGRIHYFDIRHSSFVIPSRPDQVIGNNGALGFGE
jgi:hypothetical protein